MENSSIFVFRIDYQYENEFVRQELRAGRLRQGWGRATLRADDSPSTYAPDTFTRETKAAWPDATEEEARARYRILYPMLEMKPGDLVVVPKYPDPHGRTFAIVEVSGVYHFDLTKYEDYGHCIPIDAGTIREFRYDESLSSKRVSGKFTSYRSAINNVWNEAFIEAVNTLWTGSRSPLPATGLWSDDAQDFALTHVRGLISDLPPSAIEDLVARTFTQEGYELEQRHHCDGQGGDADLVLSINLPLLSEAQGTDLKLFVQVKKRNGADPGDVHGLEQLERIASDEPMALKALFTTANCVSPEAEKIAHEKGIVLIGGDMAAAFLARGLFAQAA